MKYFKWKCSFSSLDSGGRGKSRNACGLVVKWFNLNISKLLEEPG